ncbi:hypothetical protein [Candidatus Sneabacter namystus]|uniref:hypothetical protein n=1 Tax=Candidatus Sneabacter namystus TaxID=2601646 RepID=UPI00155B2C34|nr:hypothetical protein [Candidatus Sneabacter namystus]
MYLSKKPTPNVKMLLAWTISPIQHEKKIEIQNSLILNKIPKNKCEKIKLSNQKVRPHAAMDTIKENNGKLTNTPAYQKILRYTFLKLGTNSLTLAKTYSTTHNAPARFCSTSTAKLLRFTREVCNIGLQKKASPNRLKT